MLMVTTTKDTGPTTKQTAKESMFTVMAASLKVSGKMISKMDMGSKYGLMEHVIKATTRLVRNTEWVSSVGQTEANMQDNSWTIIFMVMELIPGPMVGPIKVSGRITRWTAWVNSPGLMDENIMETI